MESAKEKQGRILLVDDESAILRTFRYCLEDEGYTVATANSAAQAEALLQRQVFDLCFLDLRLGEDNGLDVLAQMRIQAPWMRVVIVTAHSAVDTAVDAFRPVRLIIWLNRAARTSCAWPPPNSWKCANCRPASKPLRARYASLKKDSILTAPP